MFLIFKLIFNLVNIITIFFLKFSFYLYISLNIVLSKIVCIYKIITSTICTYMYIRLKFTEL